MDIITHKQRNLNTIGDFVGSSANVAGCFGASPRAGAPYLTITNKCTVVSVKNEIAESILASSKDLFTEFQIYQVLAPEILSERFKKGFLKCKFINDKLMSVYDVPNKFGNSEMRGKSLNDGHLSNSVNSSLQSANRLRELIQANPEFKYFATLTFDRKKVKSRKDAVESKTP